MADQPKPSKNEQEYFARLDAERLEHRREQEKLSAHDAERRSHHQRCPKCGGHLMARKLHRIEIDTCPDCKGSWFDYGEVRALVGHYDKGLVFRVMDDVMNALGKNPSPKDDL